MKQCSALLASMIRRRLSAICPPVRILGASHRSSRRANWGPAFELNRHFHREIKWQGTSETCLLLYCPAPARHPRPLRRLVYASAVRCSSADKVLHRKDGAGILDLQPRRGHVTMMPAAVEGSGGEDENRFQPIIVRALRTYLKVSEAKKIEVINSNMAAHHHRLHALVREGGKAHQVFECPQVLLLGDQHSLDVVTAELSRQALPHSLPVVHVALRAVLRKMRKRGTSADMRDAVETYVASMKGFTSFSDVLMEALDCADQELVELLMKNPQLGTVRNVAVFLHKLRLLLSNGVTVEEVKVHSRVLTDVNLRDLSKRVSLFKAWYADEPLPLEVLARNCPLPWVTTRLQRTVGGRAQRRLGTFQELATALELPPGDDSGEALEQSTKMKTLKISTNSLRKKIAFLKAKGFAADSVISQPKVLQLSMDRLKKTFALLEDMGLENPALEVVIGLAFRQSIPARTFGRIERSIAEVLDCPVELVCSIPSKFDVARIQTKYTLAQNLTFLQREGGFSREELLACPVVLFHNPAVLRQFWEDLQSGQSTSRQVAFVNLSKTIQVNLLQYEIEKQHNFTQPVVLSKD